MTTLVCSVYPTDDPQNRATPWAAEIQRPEITCYTYDRWRDDQNHLWVVYRATYRGAIRAGVDLLRRAQKIQDARDAVAALPNKRITFSYDDLSERTKTVRPTKPRRRLWGRPARGQW